MGESGSGEEEESGDESIWSSSQVGVGVGSQSGKSRVE